MSLRPNAPSTSGSMGLLSVGVVLTTTITLLNVLPPLALLPGPLQIEVRSIAPACSESGPCVEMVPGNYGSWPQDHKVAISARVKKVANVFELARHGTNLRSALMLTEEKGNKPATPAYWYPLYRGYGNLDEIAEDIPA